MVVLTDTFSINRQGTVHLSKAADITMMEMVNPDITDTCKDLGDAKLMFQLTLLCSKRRPGMPRTSPNPAHWQASPQSSAALSYINDEVPSLLPAPRQMQK